MSESEFLNLGEVAAYLGWTPRFVERLAAGGKLPGTESNGQWRFRRADLLDWLDQKIQTLESARVDDLDHRLETELESAPAPHVTEPIRLSTTLTAPRIALGVAAASKSAVLNELVDLADRAGALHDRGVLRASLAEREALQSTALPGGVAICHPRRPVPFALRGPLLCLLRTREPVPFGAVGGEPTELFFLFAALDERSHLQGLARLVRVLRGRALEALRGAASPAEVLTIVGQCERALLAAGAG